MTVGREIQPKRVPRSSTLGVLVPYSVPQVVHKARVRDAVSIRDSVLEHFVAIQRPYEGAQQGQAQQRVLEERLNDIGWFRIVIVVFHRLNCIFYSKKSKNYAVVSHSLRLK